MNTRALTALTALILTLLAALLALPATALAGGGVNCGFGSFEGAKNTVRLFPTYGVLSPKGDAVLIPIHVWVYEREEDRIRRAAVGAFRRQLGIEKDSPEYPIFKRRMLDFMVDNESGETVYARVTGDGVEKMIEKNLGETEGNGHLITTLEVPYKPPKDAAKRKVRLSIRLGGAEHSGRSVEVPIVEAKGVTVISDIDDTIKITNVLDKKELLANTFLREFKPAPGMATLFQHWAEQGASFHYVSASPWALQADLARFADASGFPSGVYHLRILRLKDITSVYAFANGSAPHKLTSISTLMSRFPERRFILVGDTGEKDPEVYGEIARRYPAQIEHIYLRRVEGAANDDARFAAALEGVPTEKWTVFAEPPRP